MLMVHMYIKIYFMYILERIPNVSVSNIFEK